MWYNRCGEWGDSFCRREKLVVRIGDIGDDAVVEMMLPWRVTFIIFWVLTTGTH